MSFCHEPTSNAVLDDIRKKIPEFLSGHRLLHTYSVEAEAVELAKIFFYCLGIDNKYINDISAAALLHDITKQFSHDRQAEICKKHSISSDCSQAVLHSRTGAYAAKEYFGINDTVFSAIFCHTTGKANMNIFEKIIFIADYIEPLRTHASCVSARNYFYENIYNNNKIFVLNKTILMSIDSTLDFLISKENEIDIETIKARNSVLSELANIFRGVNENNE